MDKRILEQIKKLLAMAGDKGSPNEAATALRMARALMAKQGLSQAEFYKNQHASEIVTQYTLKGNAKKMPLWKPWLVRFLYRLRAVFLPQKIAGVCCRHAAHTPKRTLRELS